MKKTIFCLVVMIVSIQFPTYGIGSYEIFKTDSMKLAWESPGEFRVPESVCYDIERGVIYVANINGRPDEKNGKGFISKLSLEGKIVRLKWIEGLSAPKGMGIAGGFLYVSDIDHVVKIDIEKNKIRKRYKAEGARFLNDISIDKTGNVYISGMVTNRIYRLKEGKVDVWLETGKLNTPNGLYVKNGNLLVGTKGAVLSIDLATKGISLFIENTGRIDGLVPDGNGNYFISDWYGHIHLVHPQKKMVTLLDTTPVKINAADIDFVIEKKLLLIPTFYDNRVVAYEVTRK